MPSKNVLWVLISGVALVACGERPRPDAGHDAGCIGACGNKDGGTDGGTDGGQPGLSCEGIGWDGGIITAYEAQTGPACMQAVSIKGIVVDGVFSKASRVSTIDGGLQWKATFWAEEADGGAGVYIDKYFTDPPTEYEPHPGDNIDVTGYLVAWTDNRNPNPGNVHRDGYRHAIRSAFNLDAGTAKLLINLNGRSNDVPTVEATDVLAFGADAGAEARSTGVRGARIHIPGPLTLTQADPSYMLRYNMGNAGAANQYLFLDPTRDNYNGFEVTGGVVVDDYLTHLTCDYRGAVHDGGTVTFPGGISGIWDSYTMEPFISGTCANGPSYTDCLTPGFIPGPDGGVIAPYINVLWPQDCVTDLDGGITYP